MTQHQREFRHGPVPDSVFVARMAAKTPPPLPVNRHSLTKAEWLSLIAYTTGPACWNGAALNAALRSPNPPAEMQSYRDTLTDALAKLPTHQGLVYRRTALPAAVLAQYRQGMKVRDWGFTSASATRFSLWHQDPFLSWHADHQFSIRSRTGKCISHYSAVSNGQEVLFEAGTRFCVMIRCDHPRSNRVNFELQEVRS